MTSNGYEDVIRAVVCKFCGKEYRSVCDDTTHAALDGCPACFRWQHSGERYN